MDIYEALEVAKGLAIIDSSVDLSVHDTGSHFYSVMVDGFCGVSTASWEDALAEVKGKLDRGRVERLAEIKAELAILEGAA